MGTQEFEAELLVDDWAKVHPELEVNERATPQGEETLYRTAPHRTAQRQEK